MDAHIIHVLFCVYSLLHQLSSCRVSAWQTVATLAWWGTPLVMSTSTTCSLACTVAPLVTLLVSVHALHSICLSCVHASERDAFACTCTVHAPYADKQSVLLLQKYFFGTALQLVSKKWLVVLRCCLCSAEKSVIISTSCVRVDQYRGRSG